MNTSQDDPTPTEDAAEVENSEAAEQPEVQWKPLTRFQRRVAGVLVEKSKTTPDIYPMTLNGIKTASNQKSNRSPQLDLREDQVEETLYELRKLGAVIEVHSGGRVPKFKHQLYEWMGVEQVELAVMAELLLRGEQTVGDLRGRAARMDRIAGVSELMPIVRSLIKKNLIIELTPPGRGQIVTHNLYQADELTRLKTEHGNYESGSSDIADHVPVRSTEAVSPSQVSPADDSRINSLETEVAGLKQEIEQLKSQVAELKELLS